MMASSSIPATAVQKESRTEPNWLELPIDVTRNILQRLNTVDIITRACQVCPLWWNICKDPSMWHTIRMSNIHGNHAYLKKICHSAVGRSCGQLEDIDIQYFANDDLLGYIVHCAKHLRRMRLVECKDVSHTGFTEAVKRLPLLEELEISHCVQSKYSLQDVGRYCPLLKSLKYSMSIDEEHYIELHHDQETGFIIAETGSKVHHLKSYIQFLTMEEVLAILDGIHQL